MTGSQLGSLAAQGRQNGYVASHLSDDVHHRLQFFAVGNECLAIDGEHQIASVLNAVETCRTLPARLILTEGVHEDVANHINAVQLGSFARSNTAGTNACRKQ